MTRKINFALVVVLGATWSTGIRGQSIVAPSVRARTLGGANPVDPIIFHEAAAAQGEQLSAVEQGFGEAMVTADFGTASVFASLSLSVPVKEDFRTSAFHGEATWRDRVTILPSDPALLGTRGKFTPRYDVPYEIRAQSGGFGLVHTGAGASVNTWIYAGAPPTFFSGSDQSAGATFHIAPSGQSTSGTFGPPPGVWRTNRPVQFIFGEPFILETRVLAAVGGDVSEGTSQSAFVNLSKGVTWGGFDNGVLDASDNPVLFNLQSETGVDWSTPSLVPWNTATGGADYHTDANWIFGEVPDLSQSVLLAREATYHIDNIDASNRRLVARAGDVTLNATHLALTSASLNDPSVVVGEFSGNDARVTLASGNLTSRAAAIAEAEGSAGEMRISGATARFAYSDVLIVGDAGAGTLRITGGAKLHTAAAGPASRSPDLAAAPQFEQFPTLEIGRLPGSIGDFSVEGPGSTSIREGGPLVIARGGNAQFGVLQGGAMEEDDIFAGLDAGAVAHLVVDGSQSQLKYRNAIRLGRRGYADLTVRNEGTVVDGGTVPDVYLGEEAGGEGRIFVVGQNSSFDGPRTQFQIGRAGKGAIEVDQGGLLRTDHVVLGLQEGAKGELTISATGSRWTTDGAAITIGDQGEGVVKIGSGAAATAGHSTIGFSSSGTGSLTVRGADARFELNGTGGGGNVLHPDQRPQIQIDRDTGPDGLLAVGVDGAANLFVAEGGYVRAVGVIAGAGTGYGIVTVEGPHSELVTGPLWIGNRGSGELIVRNQATVTTRQFLVGGRQHQHPAGPLRTTATISGAGTRLVVEGTGEVRVGDWGQATVIVEQGGFVSSKDLQLATFSGTGHLLIDGIGSAWDAAGPFSMHRGQLQVTAGGRLETLGGTINPPQADSAVVSISGQQSTWNLKSQPLYLGTDRRGPSRFGVGRLDVRVENGGQLIGSDIFVRYDSILSGDGTIIGNVRNAGAIRPGRSPGRLTIDGHFEHEDVGILELEFAGNSAGSEYDQLIVTGDATVNGEIIFKFVNGFAPQQGQEFDFLNVAGAVTGGFISSRYHGLMPGFEYNIRQEGDHFMLTALNDGVACQPGSADMDQDGNIGRIDVARLIQRFGQDALPLAGPGDFNCDGAITVVDLSHLQQQFSKTAASNSVAVPEPAMIILLIGVLIWASLPRNLLH